MAPLFRGVGHKSFVCQVRFDYYAMDYFNRAKLEQEKLQETDEGELDEISQETHGNQDNFQMAKSSIDKGKLRDALGGAGEAE